MSSTKFEFRTHWTAVIFRVNRYTTVKPLTQTAKSIPKGYNLLMGSRIHSSALDPHIAALPVDGALRFQFDPRTPALMARGVRACSSTQNFHPSIPQRWLLWSKHSAVGLTAGSGEQRAVKRAVISSQYAISAVHHRQPPSTGRLFVAHEMACSVLGLCTQLISLAVGIRAPYPAGFFSHGKIKAVPAMVL